VIKTKQLTATNNIDSNNHADSYCSENGTVAPITPPDPIYEPSAPST
jgi:hypothetical protein